MVNQYVQLYPRYIVTRLSDVADIDPSEYDSTQLDVTDWTQWHSKILYPKERTDDRKRYLTLGATIHQRRLPRSMVLVDERTQQLYKHYVTRRRTLVDVAISDLLAITGTDVREYILNAFMRLVGDIKMLYRYHSATGIAAILCLDETRRYTNDEHTGYIGRDFYRYTAEDVKSIYTAYVLLRSEQGYQELIAFTPLTRYLYDSISPEIPADTIDIW